MSETKEPLEVLDLSAYETIDNVRFDVVEDAYGPGQHTRIGSVNSLDMIQWMEDNDSKDPEIRKTGGLRLLVKSIVDKNGARLPEEQSEKWLQIFGAKDAQANGRVIAAALVLNGLRKPKAQVEAAKNDSGEALPAASPIN